MDVFRDPSEADRLLGEDLIGRRISIFWDGDNVFYPAIVKSYNVKDRSHSVRYENDASDEDYTEKLIESTWKISDRVVKIEAISTKSKTAAAVKSASYHGMVYEALVQLDDRAGVSLPAIRKYILANYESTNKKQPASFNSLTLKAISKAIAVGEVERVSKNTFRLSVAERNKRSKKEKEFDYVASSTSKSSKPAEKLKKDHIYSGTILEINKQARSKMADFRKCRDAFMKKHIGLFEPFLPSKNHFNRKEKELQEAAAIKNTVDTAIDDEFRRGNILFALQSSSFSSSSSIDIGGCDVHASISVADITSTSLAGVEGVGRASQITAVSSTVVEAIFAPMQVASRLPAEEAVVGTEQDKGATVDTHATAEAGAAEGAAEEDEESVSTAAASALVGESTVSFAMREVELVPTAPALIANLHDHQLQGISWMVHMFKNGMPMILGDQMGLGKTIQSIGFLAYIHHFMQQRGPHLVVAPLSVLSNWLSEIERFCPSLRAVRFHGPKAERNRIRTEEMMEGEFDIVVTTFEILVSECNFFKRRFMWTTVIVDEGHRLKNERSQLSEKLRVVPCLCKIILTGTPLQNNLRELWALLHFLAPDVFTPSSAEYFEEGFDLLRGVVDAAILRRARKLLCVFMLRRLKEQVAISLPSRREVTILVPLTEQQVTYYKQLLCGLDSDTVEAVMRETLKPSTVGGTTTVLPNGGSMHAQSGSSLTEITASVLTAPSNNTMSEYNRSGSGDSEWRKLMNLLLQLRKVCNHTYLLPDAAPDPYEISEDIVGGSGKLLMLDRMLPRLRQAGNRVLLFSQFTSMLDILEDYCELRDYPFVRLDGETNRVKRRLDVRRFNAPKSSIFIFLISTRAGGLGLNLASADTVILYDSDWNPQVDLQAMERAHRIGQTKPVRVYRLVCQGSVEERMVLRAEKKLYLNAMVAEADPDEVVSEHGSADAEIAQALGIGGATMSKGELASLIRFGANAVFQGSGSDSNSSGNGGVSISDEQLDRLLEMQGRDLPALASHEDAETMGPRDDIEEAQKILLQRLETMQEVDLRQFGNMVYNKRKARSVDEIALENILKDSELLPAAKRLRKERIVMVSGKGTGYGGNVPVLAETMQSAPQSEAPTFRRGRQWTHMCYCGLCGKSKLPETFTKCSYCPRIFHDECMTQFGVTRPDFGTFVCPHHKCASCSRGTQSAGGMLFRCTGCMTAYCEDCLPQDEIESVGRCRAFEALGYDSQQSYFIKCPTCCVFEGVSASGVTGEGSAVSTVTTEHSARRDIDEGAEEGDTDMMNAMADDEEEEKQPPLPTQLMRVHWTEVVEKKAKKKSKKRAGGKGKVVKAAIDIDSDEEEDEVDTKPKKSSKACSRSDSNSVKGTAEKQGRGKPSNSAYKDEDDDDESEVRKQSSWIDNPVYNEMKVPKTCTLKKAYDLLAAHPLTEICFAESGVEDEEKSLSRMKISVSPRILFGQIITKITNGRYRSVSGFANDVHAALDLVPKPAKTIAESSNPVRRYQAYRRLRELFDRSLLPKIQQL